MTRPKASGWYHAATKAQTAPDEIPTIACGVESAKQHSHRQHTLLLTCFCTHCVLGCTDAYQSDGTNGIQSTNSCALRYYGARTLSAPSGERAYSASTSGKMSCRRKRP